LEANKLEEDFIYDSDYKRLADKIVNKIPLSVSEDIELNLKYLNYIIKCFQLGYKLNVLLQSTLMVDIKKRKDLLFINSSEFYHSLANYRDNLSNSIANYKIKSTLDLFKRVVGYYYTYKVLFLSEETALLDSEIFQFCNLITQESSLKLLKKANTINSNTEKEMKEYATNVKYCFQKVYYQTNTLLSKRNVLPKIKQKQNEDCTLI
jgi:hypothetical protein